MKVLRTAIPFLLMLAVVFALMASAEEARRNGLFLDTLPDKAVRMLEDFRSAVRRKDADAAARLFQNLHAQWADKLVKGAEEGLYVPLSKVITGEFLSLGEAGLAAFRERFDPSAERLAAEAREDPAQARALLAAYPFSSYADEARMMLAVWNADEGRFPVAAHHLERLLSAPSALRERPAAVALLIRCYAESGDVTSLSTLAKRLEREGAAEVRFRSTTLGALAAAALDSARKPPGGPWSSPGGAPSGARPFSSSVGDPALLWSAAIVPDPLFEDSALEKPFVPFINPDSPPRSVSVVPVLAGKRLFLQSGAFVYSRDLETGFYLQRYPVGRNMVRESRVPVLPSRSALYSLSTWNGNLYAFFSPPGTLRTRSSGSIEAYRIEGGDRLFDNLTLRRYALKSEETSAAASLSFVSVPLAHAGQVLALGVVQGGMGDVYAVSLDASDGRLLWLRRVFTYALPRTTSSELAATVPASAAGKAVFYFRGGVFCLDASDGSVLWLNSYETVEGAGGHVFPPALFPDRDVALIFPPDGGGVYAYALSSGRLLWKAPMRGCAFIGTNGGRAWFQHGGVVTALDPADGSNVFTFRVQPGENGRPVNGVGAVAGDKVILPVTGGLIFCDARTGRVLSRVLFPTLARTYLGRVFPFGEYIVCASPEAVYCFTDRARFLEKADRMAERDPSDPLPHYLKGKLFLNSGEFSAALAELKKALDSARPNDRYEGYPLASLIRAHLSLYYRKLAEDDKDPARIYLHASQGLQFADSPYDRAFLLQLMAAGALEAGETDKAFDVFVELLSAGSDAAEPCRMFTSALSKAKLAAGAGDESASLHELCIEAAAKLSADHPELVEAYEKQAEKYAEAALAGDAEAAGKVLGALFFTERARLLAGELVGRAVAGELTEPLKKVLLDTAAVFPVDRSPQLAFARALLNRESCPALCDRVMSDLARFFPDAVIKLPEGPKTLAELAPRKPEKDEKAQVRPPDFSNGLETAWRLTLSRKRLYFNPPLLACKGGLILPFGEKNALTFLSAADGSVRWSVTPPDRAFVGVSLDSSSAPPGALVVSLVPGYPAEAAGVLPGDVIVEFAGMKVRSHQELIKAISRMSPGEPTTMKVLRGGEELTIAITPTVRRGEDFVPDMIMGLFDSGDGKVVALRRSFLTSMFHFEAFDLATGELVWRRTFDDLGYPNSFERLGDLVILFCTPLRAKAEGALLFFDLRTGRSRRVSLPGNYYHRMYAFAGPRMALAVFAGSSSTISVFDVLSGARSLLFRPDDRTFLGAHGFAGRYLPYNSGQDLRLLDLFSGRTADGPRGARVICLNGERALLYLTGGSLGVAKLDPEAGAPVPLSPPLGSYPSQAVAVNDRFGLFFSRFQYFIENSRLMFPQFLVADPAHRVLTANHAMPTGSYVRRVFSGGGLVFADFNGQLERYKGLVVLDPATGRVVLRHMNASTGGLNAAVGDGMIFVDDGDSVTAYRAATREGKKRLAARAEKTAESPEPDSGEVLRICEEMLNARMYEECISFCDSLLTSGAEIPASQVEGLRGFAREELFESRPRGRYVPARLHVKVDGDLSEWGDDGWSFLGRENVASSFFKWTYPESPADLSVSFKTALDDDGISLAVRVLDDELISADDNEGEPWTSDHLELFACAAGGFRGDYPPGGSLWLSLSPGPDGLSLERFVTPASGRALAPGEYDKHPIRAAFSRRGTTTSYEVFIPMWYFEDSPEGADPSRIAFNLMVVDRDRTRMDAPVQIVELAPTFSPHLYSYMRVSLFPRLVLFDGREGR